MDDLIIGDDQQRVIIKDIIISEYAPDIFAKLRHIDGYKVESLQESLNIEENIENIRKAGEGMGKSGSFFFFSHDNEFLIKTMTMSDFNAFSKLFMYYFEYVNTHERSLLARIYGVYSV